MASDFIRINNFKVCRKFNLSKYVCELPPEKRICDRICIKAQDNLSSTGVKEAVDGSSADS